VNSGSAATLKKFLEMFSPVLHYFDAVSYSFDPSLGQYWQSDATNWSSSTMNWGLKAPKRSIQIWKLGFLLTQQRSSKTLLRIFDLRKLPVTDFSTAIKHSNGEKLLVIFG
jgi:hypothetical protein